ncbi:carbohydrate ABC transporter substrate-binding protein, partial [Candidatus Bipolaricaulota bacterium]|nr:carbohydrate ABC transporter substrate-binding protein [Candidatus Bipolaricaulota bacterium]
EAVAPFTAETGTEMQFETSREQVTVLFTRVEAGNPPDIAILPQPGLLVDLAKMGALVSIDTFMDMDQLKKDYAQAWIDLGSYDGTLYGIWYKSSLKSLVWYSPAAFEAGGYEVPTTWDELIALSDQIVADGGVPWCLGIESGAASGWPATDWIEDIMLRTAGPEFYDQWAAHEVPWTDPKVKRAFEVFGDIVLNEDYVFGGTTGVLTTNFGDSPNDLFTDPPNAYLHHQASFIEGFFTEDFPDLVPGVDYDWFVTPPIDAALGTPAFGGGNIVVTFSDSAEAQALMRYLASAAVQEVWAARVGYISANKNVNMNVYPTDIARGIADSLVNAVTFRFDGSDLMPDAIGSGAFWTGIVDYVGGMDLDTVLQMIEDSY